MTHTEPSTDRIDEFSPPADGLVHSSRTLVDQTRRVTDQLQASLSTLAMIDQAIGILISRVGGSAEEANAALRDVSHSHDTDLATVARQIVEQVARRSQARHVQRGNTSPPRPRSARLAQVS